MFWEPYQILGQLAEVFSRMIKLKIKQLRKIQREINELWFLGKKSRTEKWAGSFMKTNNMVKHI